MFGALKVYGCWTYPQNKRSPARLASRLPSSLDSVILFNNAAPLAAGSDRRAVRISARGGKPYALGVFRC
jgi:hypothetical protein